MAMNFFEHQERARRHTGRLVVLFLLGVTALVASTYFIGLLVATALSHAPPRGVDPGLLGVSVGVTLLVVGLGYLRKSVALSAGGRAVAESLGGRVVEPTTMDPDERKVLNVVEEMAIASGVPVPPVYVIPDESINAFAAGLQPQRAVIGITRGAIRELPRDELQGVVAHEFSHILNGDMRLNVRLVCAVFGLAALTSVGYVLMRHIGANLMRGSSRSRGKGGGGGIGMVFILGGLGLMVIGWVGQLFGRMMQAAVSRQREFLADASAVQFTRNPAGLAGALRRIAERSANRLDQPQAGDYCHLFFTSALDTLFATHPPLEERIARLEARPAAAVAQELAGAAVGPAFTGASMVREFAASTRGRADVAAAVAAAGTASPGALEYARTVRSRMPGSLLSASREPFDARAVVAAALLSSEPSARMAQLAALGRAGDPLLGDLAVQLAPTVAEMPRDLRLPLVDLCVPALSRLSQPQMASFQASIRALITADARVDLFEWAVRVVLARAFMPPPARGNATLLAQAPDFGVVLGTLAWAGSRGAEDAGRAFMAGCVAAGVQLPMQERDACTLDLLDASMRKLASLRPSERDRAVDGLTACVTADETVTVTEAEILRSVVSYLGAPVPPVLPGLPGASDGRG